MDDRRHVKLEEHAIEAKTPFRVLRPWVSSYAMPALRVDSTKIPSRYWSSSSNKCFFDKGNRDTVINTYFFRGSEKAERLIARDNAALEHSRTFTLLLHKHTMYRRTVEEKDGRRVSSTALGKGKSTGLRPGEGCSRPHGRARAASRGERISHTFTSSSNKNRSRRAAGVEFYR